MKPKNIEVTKFPIKLGQFLKLAEIADDGIHAKLLIQRGSISVNDEITYSRGKQLFEHDLISYSGKHYTPIYKK